MLAWYANGTFFCEVWFTRNSCFYKPCFTITITVFQKRKAWLPRVQEMVSEKKKFFKVREMSGNFILGQGKLAFWRKVRENWITVEPLLSGHPRGNGKWPLNRGSSGIGLTLPLTTASQSGGWVPETSRSFQYWQPAARWKPLPWLANPGNPAMSPHAEGKLSRHPSHWWNSGKGEGKGGSMYSNASMLKGF